MSPSAQSKPGRAGALPLCNRRASRRGPSEIRAAGPEAQGTTGRSSTGSAPQHLVCSRLCNHDSLPRLSPASSAKKSRLAEPSHPADRANPARVGARSGVPDRTPAHPPRPLAVIRSASRNVPPMQSFRQCLTSACPSEVSISTPLPGTPRATLLAGRVLDRHWGNYDFHHVVFQPAGMQPEELQAGHDWVTRQFYRPGQILRRLVRHSRRPRSLASLPYVAAVNAAHLSRTSSPLAHSRQGPGRTPKRIVTRTLDPLRCKLT